MSQTSSPEPSAATSAASPVVEEVVPRKRESAMLSLRLLLIMRWEDNPKLHQDAMIEFSINKYGFKDPIGVCLAYNLVCTGHGRLSVLARMKESGLPAPNGIDYDAEGDWLVPVELLSFESREQALQYALVHNRSGTHRLDHDDYDPIKLSRALSAAIADAAQETLPGFGVEDLVGSASLSSLDLPPLPVFDADTIQPAMGGIFDASKL